MELSSHSGRTGLHVPFSELVNWGKLPTSQDISKDESFLSKELVK